MMGAGQKLTAVGLAVGLAFTYLGGRIVAISVHAMRAGDPVILATAGVIVAAVTFAATMVPAIRASRLDPARALRPD